MWVLCLLTPEVFATGWWEECGSMCQDSWPMLPAETGNAQGCEWSQLCPSLSLRVKMTHLRLCPQGYIYMVEMVRRGQSIASPCAQIQVALSDVSSQPGAPNKPSFLTLLLHSNPWDLPSGLTQELKDHDVINILRQLPLLSSIRQQPAGGIPILGNLVNSVLNYIIW